MAEGSLQKAGDHHRGGRNAKGGSREGCGPQRPPSAESPLLLGTHQGQWQQGDLPNQGGRPADRSHCEGRHQRKRWLWAGSAAPLPQGSGLLPRAGPEPTEKLIMRSLPANPFRIFEGVLFFKK